jgi:outer membrane protein assembly factor BamB
MNESAPVFTVESGRLIAWDAATGEIRWQGELLGAPVSDVKAIPGTERAVVLLDYISRSSGPFQNLACVDEDGQVVWTASLPSASNTDAYVSFELGRETIFANSWSGYQVQIDLLSGSIRDKSFTK